MSMDKNDLQKIKAAYALNMCTVSVSQIVDYNDEYILEQEYEAILNNLNLEQMPKDEALLDILVRLLNVTWIWKCYKHGDSSRTYRDHRMDVSITVL